MYTVHIKQGAYRYDNSSQKTGLNLDNYFRALLIKYGVVIPNDSCCQTNALSLQPGTYQFTPHHMANIYDLERYFTKMLIHFGVLTQIQVDAICCKSHSRLEIFTDKLFFSKTSIISNKGSLTAFINRKLTEFNIPYNKLCC